MPQKNKKKRTFRVSILMDYDAIKDKVIVEKILEEAKKRGKIIRSRIYITQEELNDSRQALPEFASLGLEPVITVLAKNVKFAIDLLDDAYSDNIDVIIISWKSEDLLPALIEAKTKKEIVIMFPGKAPKSFYTVADSIIELEL